MSENALTVEAMKQIEQRWATVKDMPSLLAIYTDDAMFDNISGQPVIGKDAIEAVYNAMDEEGEIEGRKKGKIQTVEHREAVVLGDWGYTSGNWMVKHPFGRVDKGTYLNVIKLVDGEAKMFRHIFEITEQSYK